jgi:hypothetical protein
MLRSSGVAMACLPNLYFGAYSPSLSAPLVEQRRQRRSMVVTTSFTRSRSPVVFSPFSMQISIDGFSWVMPLTCQVNLNRGISPQRVNQKLWRQLPIGLEDK